MIIVEGPDGAGKTSLIKRLSTDLDLEVAQKAVSSDSEITMDLSRWLKQSMVRGWQPTIYDRYALFSEPIYGSAWRGDLRGEFEDLDWLREQWFELEVVAPTVIICLPPFQTVVDNIRKDEQNSRLYPTVSRGTDSRRPKGVGQIYWQYHDLLGKNAARYYHYDYTKPDAYDTVNMFVRAMLMGRSNV